MAFWKHWPWFDFISHSLPAVTCLMCTLQHSCHLGTVSMNTGMLLHARSPRGRLEGDKGFSFVEAGTPTEAFTERFVSLCFCVCPRLAHWSAGPSLEGSMGTWAPARVTGEEQFQCLWQPKRHELLVSGLSLACAAVIVAADTHLTNDSNLKAR